MKITKLYQCEFCEKEFRTEAECKMHESEHKLKAFKDMKVSLWDYCGNPLEKECLEDGIDHVYGFICETAEDFKLLEELALANEDIFPSRFPVGKEKIHWFYDIEKREWFCIEELLLQIEKYKEKYFKGEVWN